MLNIITINYFKIKPTGPQKLARNLVKGLKLIGEPYIINGNPNIYKNIFIIDDNNLFMSINSFPKDAEILAGPCLIPKKGLTKSFENRYRYVAPSNRVKKICEKYKFHKKCVCWPVGIDTYLYKPFNNKKDSVVVYFKFRNPKELEYCKLILEKLCIKYTVLNYNLGYTEEEFLESFKNAKYCIWIGGSESQGIALEEILSMNVPIVVCDVKKAVNYENTNLYEENEGNEFATSAEYFDEMCGIKMYDLINLEEKICYMEENYEKYNPRKYVMNNLTLEKQARELLGYYTNIRRGDDIPVKKFNFKNLCLKIIRKIFDCKFLYKLLFPIIKFIYKIYNIVSIFLQKVFLFLKKLKTKLLKIIKK